MDGKMGEWGLGEFCSIFGLGYVIMFRCRIFGIYIRKDVIERNILGSDVIRMLFYFMFCVYF